MTLFLFMFFSNKYEIQFIAILYNTRHAPTAARALISMRSSNRAYPTYVCVRLRSWRRWGGKANEKLPCSSRRWSLLDPRTPSSKIIVPPSIATRHLAQSSHLLRGLGRREDLSLRRCSARALASLPKFSSCPVSVAVGFPIHVQSRHSVRTRSYPSVPFPVVYAVRGPHVRAF
jgi:hypothetical protein